MSICNKTAILAARLLPVFSKRNSCINHKLWEGRSTTCPSQRGSSHSTFQSPLCWMIPELKSFIFSEWTLDKWIFCHLHFYIILAFNLPFLKLVVSKSSSSISFSHIEWWPFDLIDLVSGKVALHQIGCPNTPLLWCQRPVGWEKEWVTGKN